MFCNAFLYRWINDEKSGDPVVDIPNAIGIAVMTMIITAPVTVLFVIIFKRAQAAKNSTLRLLEVSSDNLLWFIYLTN